MAGDNRNPIAGIGKAPTIGIDKRILIAQARIIAQVLPIDPAPRISHRRRIPSTTNRHRWLRRSIARSRLSSTVLPGARASVPIRLSVPLAKSTSIRSHLEKSRNFVRPRIGRSNTTVVVAEVTRPSSCTAERNTNSTAMAMASGTSTRQPVPNSRCNASNLLT